ncbi:MAG: signal peptidase II [Enterobacterales bacterium]
MNKIFYNVKIYYLTIILTLMFWDIFAKYLISQNLLLGELIKVNPYMNIIYSYNSGIALGFLSNNQFKYYFFCISAAIMCAICFIEFKDSHNKFFISNVYYLLIISGTLGNLLNRVFYGVVIDFIDIHIYDWHIPLFNIADFYIFTGIICIFLNKFILNKLRL